jgi:hypothetical protein
VVWLEREKIGEELLRALRKFSTAPSTFNKYKLICVFSEKRDRNWHFFVNSCWAILSSWLLADSLFQGFSSHPANRNICPGSVSRVWAFPSGFQIPLNPNHHYCRLNAIYSIPYRLWARYVPHTHDPSARAFYFLGKLAWCVNCDFLSSHRGPWQMSHQPESLTAHKGFLIKQTFWEMFRSFVLLFCSQTSQKIFWNLQNPHDRRF